MLVGSLAHQTTRISPGQLTAPTILGLQIPSSSHGTIATASLGQEYALIGLPFLLDPRVSHG